MPDDLIPADGGDGQAAGTWEGDLGFPDTQPDTVSDVEPDGALTPKDTPEGDTPVEGGGDSQGQDTPGDTQTVPTWKFRDKVYDDPNEFISAVDQHNRSWDGRMRALQQQLAEAENRNQQWESWHDYVESQKANATQEPEPEPKEPWDVVNWKDVKSVIDQHGVENGIKYAMMQAFPELKAHTSKEVKRVESEIGDPVKAMEEARIANQYANDLWMSEASKVHPETGEAIYPELNERVGDKADPQAMQMVVGEWMRLRQINPQFAHTPQGIAQAVNNFRLWALQTDYKPEGERAAEASAAGDAAKEVVRDAQGRFVKQNKAKNDAASGGSATPTPTPDNTGRTQSVSEAAFRARVKNAGRKNISEKDQVARNIFGVR
jgi:hypothetical protein